MYLADIKISNRGIKTGLWNAELALRPWYAFTIKRMPQHSQNNLSVTE
jgi:hypothetical protein